MQNAGLDEAQVGIKIVGEISKTSDMQKEKNRKPLDESEREELKSWLKTKHSEN